MELPCDRRRHVIPRPPFELVPTPPVHEGALAHTTHLPDMESFFRQLCQQLNHRLGCLIPDLSHLRFSFWGEDSSGRPNTFYRPTALGEQVSILFDSMQGAERETRQPMHVSFWVRCAENFTWCLSNCCEIRNWNLISQTRQLTVMNNSDSRLTFKLVRDSI
jgi:hypothetical protein